MLLVELFTLDRNIKKSKKLEPLAEVPFILDLSEELPFEYELITGAMPYALAGQLIAEEDNERSAIFSIAYSEHLKTLRRAVIEPITDAY